MSLFLCKHRALLVRLLTDGKKLERQKEIGKCPSIMCSKQNKMFLIETLPMVYHLNKMVETVIGKEGFIICSFPKAR